MCIEMVSYSAGHCPAHSISVIYKIMATMASATSSCYGFTEYAGEVVSVEVEGWRDVGGGVWGDWPRVTALQFLGPVQASRPNRHQRGKGYKPGHVSISSPASAVSTISVPLHLLLLLLLATKSGLVTRDDAAAALQ